MKTGTEEDAARALEYEESQIDENNPEVMGKVKYGEYAITEDLGERDPLDPDTVAENLPTTQIVTGYYIEWTNRRYEC